MDRIFYYDFFKIERENKRWGFLISAILHSLLLLLILVKIFPLETDVPIVEKKEIVVELQMVPDIKEPPTFGMEGGGSSPGPESEEPQEGGSSPGSEAAPALEELEKQPTQTTKIDVVKPTPIPEKSSPKPVLTAPETQVIKIDPPKVETHPAPTKPAPTVITNPGPVVVENKPTPSKPSGSGTGGNASSGDNDIPGGTGGSGKTGTGGGTGSGGADSGTGTGGGGNAGSGTGTGSGDGVGVNFDETGPLKRKICKRASIGDLAREYVQSVAFNMCINQQGAVTYIKYNSKLSKTKDKSFVLEATKKMQQYEFCVDRTAPKKECGVFTFKIDGVIYKLNK